MKRSIAVLIAFLAICSGVIGLLVLSKDLNKKESSDGEQDPSLVHIEAKLLEKPVVEGMTPVVIFQYNEAAVSGSGGIDKVDSFLAGSGTMIKLSNGREYVITAEHLFSTHKKVNYECPKYAVKVLREKSNFITRELVDAKPFFAGRSGVVDIAVCQVTSNRDARVIPFSPFQGGGGDSEQYREHNLCTGEPEDKIIRSLVSGEKARLLCMDKISNVVDLYYFLIDYQSVPGESGEGFVDRNGHLFILKGTINEVDEVNAQLKKMGVIDKDTKSFSIVVGSLTIKK